MKRIIILALLALAILSAISIANAKTVLNFWTEFSTDPEKSTIEEIIREFNKTHPNITIVHRGIENELFFTTMRTAFTGGNPPDIFQHEGYNNLFQFVRPGEVLDISDWFKEHKDLFLAESIDSIKMNGKYWGIPWQIHTGSQIFYNKKILKQYGIEPPKTWDQFLAACETLKKKGVTPIALGSRYGWPGAQLFFALAVRTAGKDYLMNLVKRKNGYHWTDPKVVRAAELFQELNDRGYFSAGKASDDYPTAKALFLAGKAAFFHSGSWFIADLDISAPPGFELGILEFPQLSPKDQNGDPNEILAQPLLGISISKNVKDRNAAIAFLNYLIRPEVAGEWVKKVHGISAIKGAINNKTASVELQELYHLVNKATKITPFLDQIVPSEVGENALFMSSVGILTGDLTAKTWMEKVESTASKLEPILKD